MPSLKQVLQDKRAGFVRDAQAVLAEATTAGGITAEHQTKLDVIHAEIGKVDAQIKTCEQQEAIERTAVALPFDQLRVTALHDNAADRPWGRLATGRSLDAFTPRQREMIQAEAMGEFFQAVMKAGRPGAQPDPRLFQAAASGANESIGSEGGFLVGHDMSLALLATAEQQAVLLPRCMRIPVSSPSNSIRLPYINETSRADGSRAGGVVVYREPEAGTATATKPALAQLEITLLKLMAISYQTDELMQDAPAFGTILRTVFGNEFAYKSDDEILNGTGAGQCLGVLNAAALVTIDKEAGQPLKTLVPQNIVKMRARLWARSRRNAAWFINQDIEPQLHLMSLAVGTGGVPVYLPANGLAGAPFDTLYGMPVIPVEQCATLGTVGDIVLADLSQYVIAEKGGLDIATSMHVRFLNGEETFRFTMRINGKPWWSAAKTPAKGSNSTSPFVALATRA
ncbi:MAG: phage major capsid protein [Betaproteobacteria bacterium]|nr:phage major capsid protein [Betaproteobacteria bacterium]